MGSYLTNLEVSHISSPIILQENPRRSIRWFEACVNGGQGEGNETSQPHQRYRHQEVRCTCHEIFSTPQEYAMHSLNTTDMGMLVCHAFICVPPYKWAAFLIIYVEIDRVIIIFVHNKRVITHIITPIASLYDFLGSMAAMSIRCLFDIGIRILYHILCNRGRSSVCWLPGA